MIAHVLAVAMALAAVQDALPASMQPLLQVPSLTDGIAMLSVTRTPGRLELQLRGYQTPCKSPQAPLAGAALQAWLLTTNGTALRPNADPQLRFLPALGYCNERWEVSFPDAPSSELAGVVVSVRGKLFARVLEP